MYIKCQVQTLKHSLLCRFIWSSIEGKMSFCHCSKNNDYSLSCIRANLKQVYASKFYTVCRDWSGLCCNKHLQVVSLGVPPLVIINYRFSLNVFVMKKTNEKQEGQKCHKHKGQSHPKHAILFHKYKYLRISKNTLIDGVKSQKGNRNVCAEL